MGYRLYKISGWLSISLAFALITLRVLGGLFVPSEGQLITWAKEHFPYGLNIKSAQVEFVGWNPAITLRDVEVLTDDNRLALNIEKAKVVLNVYSLLFTKVELNDVILDGVKVGIEYQPDGSIIISDLGSLKWDPNALSSKRLSIRHLLVKNSDLHVSLGVGKSLPLAQVDLRMDSSLHFKISGSAVIANEVPSTVNFLIDFPLFSENTAQLFCQWQGGNLAQFVTLFDKRLPLLAMDGKLDLRLWLSVDKQGENHVVTEMELHDNPIWQSLNGWVTADGKGKSWQAQSKWNVGSIPTSYEFTASSYACAQGTCVDAQTWNIDIPNAIKIIKKLEILPSEISHKLSAFETQGVIDTFSICYEPHNTKMLIEGQALGLHYPSWFKHPIHLKDMKLLLAASTDEGVILQGNLIHANSDTTQFAGDFLLNIADNTIQDLELAVESNAWPIKNALNMLPKKVMDSTLVHWLESALLDGQIASSRFLFRGNPKDFPFDNQEGIFEANLELDKVLLHYDADWPDLSQLDARLLFQNRKMVVNATKAKIADGELVYAKAIIPNLSAPVCMLSVETKINNQLEKAAVVVQNSPLKDTVGKSLAALTFSGDMQLDLGLIIPLSSKSEEAVKVTGLISVPEASILVTEWDLKASQLKGQVAFTQDSLTAKTLTGTLLGNSVNFDVLTHQHESDTEFEIQAKGRVDYNNIQQWLKLAPTDVISGEADYIAKLSVYSDLEKHPLHLDVQSSLDKLDIKLPLPLGKPLDNARASSLILDLQPNKTARFNVQYGSTADLALIMGYEKDLWKFKGGHLNFANKAEAKVRTDGVFLVDGELEELNIQAWKELSKGTSSSTLSFEPMLALNINKFILNNEVFLKTNVEAQWDKTASLWNFNFDGPSIKGHVALPEGEDKREIIIDLQRLTLTTENESASDWADAKEVLERPIEAKIKKLKIDKKILTDFQARIEPSWKGYDFPRIQAKMKGTEIQLSGQWDAFSHIKQVTAEGKIITRNSSDTFKAIGMTGTVQQAKGNIDFSLGWHGSPAKIDFPTLLGKAEFQLTNGYVQGVNPGIGRVLNLLSLDTVTRRLNLDFSDVTKNGLAFDEFTAKFQFGKGKVSTNKVSLRGPSANIEAYGQADLQNQEISGGLIVMPNVTGSLPVAAAIAAGNPAIGAAVWVVDKMVGKKLQEIHRYRYRLVGTWDAPKLEALPVIPIRRS